jgi:hypothetical protein
MQDTFTYYCDPGHGWVQVDWTVLKWLGLNPSDFSADGNYVQRKGNTFYLEEDCDAPQFLAAYEAKTGVKPTLNEVYIADRSVIGVR